MLQNRLFLRHFIANFATSSAFEPREFENNEKTAITAVNALTNARSIVQITSKEKVGKRFRREFNLPQKAIDGLRNAIITCERPAKQLQNEADQLAKKLEQRRFPESPEKLKKLRDEVKRKLKSGKKDEISDFDKESFGGKVQEAQQYEIRNEVDRIMKKENFNWKPLEITTKESAAAYSLARLAPNYAEITRTLEEFNTIPDFQPETVLDFGSGAGAGFWAIQNKWPDVKEITMVDLSDAMMKFSMDSLRNEQSSEASQNGRPFVHNNVNFRRHLIPSLNTTYDVVLAHRVLCEIGSSETRLQLIESLWKRTNRFLILIESSQTGAFGGLLEARDFLLTQGTLVDYRKLLKSLEEAVMLSPKVVRIVEDYNLSDYEKYALLMEAVPPGHTVPTMLPTATVLAPCPHDLGCPLGVHSSCTFNTRFQPIRADGRRSEKESDGTEVSKFTYMILEKSQRKVNNEHTERILKNRKLGGHVTCDVCTAFRGIQRITLSKKHGEMYTALRSRRDGDLLPINLKTMTSSGIFEMPEEYIMSSKACIYVLGGAANTAALFDFDGVYILDGGFAEKNPGFVAHVRDVSAVLLAAPTLGNLGTTSALLEQGKPLPVFTNTKPFKTAKPGSSGEIAKAIQEANSKILSVAPPLFNPKYPANIIYQSAAKGVLSLYILAGDVKDAEVITKALAGGNEAEVEKAAAEHGTIGVLLWRPAMTDQSVVRVLISGTSSLSRIQQSLDKAAKSLPFLNVPTVKSKDALSDIPAPAVPRPVAGKPSARPATTTGTATRPTRPAVPAASAPRALTSRAPAGPSRPTTTRNAAPAPRTAVPSRATVLTKTAPASKAPTRAPVPARSAPAPPRGAPAKPAANTAKAEPIAQKKTVGKVQGTAPSKPAPAAPASAATSPAPAPEAPRRDPNNVTIVLDDSLSPEDFNQGSAPMDIVVIPPTPEPPRHEVAQATHPEESIIDAEDLAKAPLEVDDVANLADVEDEIPPPVDAFKKPEPHPEPNVSGGSEEDKIPEPVDAFKKPDPVELDDFDPLKPSHPEPSAPVVPSDHIIIATPDPELPDIVAAVPFVSPSPKGPNDGLVKLDDELEKIAPGFEEPLIPQAPRDDGTLAECSEEVSKLVEISMDTDNSAEVAADLAKAVGEVTQLSADLQNLGLDEKTDEYVRKLSNQMIEDATLPFTSALASSIVTSNGSETNGHGEQAHAAQNGGIDHQKEIPKHDLMQSRSSVIENGAAVQYEKTDPALDDVLNACAQESEKIDASHPDNLHMPAAPGSAAPAKPVKFARPYYFDVVTVPRNEKLETSVAADGLQEFISKVRSRNVILASKDISGEQLQAILCGKQTWCDSAHPCNVIPTHSSPMLLDFRQKNEEQFAANNLQFSIPVEKQRTTVSSDAGAIEYELARVDLL